MAHLFCSCCRRNVRAIPRDRTSHHKMSQYIKRGDACATVGNLCGRHNGSQEWNARDEFSSTSQRIEEYVLGSDTAKKLFGSQRTSSATSRFRLKTMLFVTTSPFPNGQRLKEAVGRCRKPSRARPANERQLLLCARVPSLIIDMVRDTAYLPLSHG